MPLRHGRNGEQVRSSHCRNRVKKLTCDSWRIMPYPTQAGQVGGHEGVGVVVKMGPGADKSNVKLGDRVGIKVGTTRGVRHRH
jgi:threonine dehydrogenase-like Zn-dependent dehydrogenase